MQRELLFFLMTGLLFAGFACAQDKNDQMTVTSPAFTHNGPIPRKYTCQGEDISPPLVITNIPAGTKTLALIVDDPDAPMGTWIHWVVFNIAPKSEIPENSVPGLQGINDFRRKDYGGPCPPSGTHRYFHKVYALDTVLLLKEGITKRQLEVAMEGHILAQAELIGLYKKK